MTRAHPSRAVAETLLFTLAQFWTTGIHWVASIASRTFLPLGVFGALGLTDAIQKYTGTANGLFRSALAREQPVVQGRGEDDNPLLDAAYTGILATLLLEVVVYLALAFFLSGWLRYAFLALAVRSFFLGINATDNVSLRNLGLFRGLTLAQMSTSTLGALVTVLLAWRFGGMGFFAGIALAAALTFVGGRIALRRGWLAHFRLRVDRRAMRRILLVGGTITGLGLVRQLLITMDRFFIAGWLSLEDLGQYTLGISVLSMALLVPTSVGGAYAPRLFRLVGRGDPSALRHATERLHATMALTTAIVAVGSLLIIHVLVNTVLPEYARSMGTYRILMLVGCGLGVQLAAYQVHVGTNRVGRAALLTSIAVVVTAGLEAWAAPHGMIWIAAALLAGVLFHTLLVNVSAANLLDGDVFTLWSLVGVGAPTLVVVLATLVPAWLLVSVHLLALAVLVEVLRRFHALTPLRLRLALRDALAT